MRVYTCVSSSLVPRLLISVGRGVGGAWGRGYVSSLLFIRDIKSVLRTVGICTKKSLTCDIIKHTCTRNILCSTTCTPIPNGLVY